MEYWNVEDPVICGDEILGFYSTSFSLKNIMIHETCPPSGRRVNKSCIKIILISKHRSYAFLIIIPLFQHSIIPCVRHKKDAIKTFYFNKLYNFLDVMI